MTCPCNDIKRKMPGCGAGTPPVLEIHSKECPVLFHTVTIPASIGDLESMPPQPGAYRNARVIYEADNVTYLYDSDGIPQLLVPDTETIIAEAVSQIPVATTGSNGLMSGADKTLLQSATTPSSQLTVNSTYNCYAIKINNVVQLSLSFETTTPISLPGYSAVVLGNLPEGWRPSGSLLGAVYSRPATNVIYFKVTASTGEVRIFNWGQALSNVENLSCTLTFVATH